MKSLDWKILSVLYEKKSITQAAESLYMTQSALTKRLKAIEAEWNIEIVYRSRKGISLTEDGTYLCKKSFIMMDFLQEIEDHFMQEQQTQEVLTLGVPNSYARLHLPRLLSFYKSRCKGLRIETQHFSSDVLLQQLMDGKLDIAIITGDYNYYGEKTELFSEKLFLVTPRGMDMEQAAQQPYIESHWNHLVKDQVDQGWKCMFGTMPHPAHHVPYSDIAIEMVENGLGVTLLFGEHWRMDEEKCQMIPVTNRDGSPIERGVWMMFNENCFKSQAVSDFISCAEEFYQTNQLMEEI